MKIKAKNFTIDTPFITRLRTSRVASAEGVTLVAKDVIYEIDLSDEELTRIINFRQRFNKKLEIKSC